MQKGGSALQLAAIVMHADLMLKDPMKHRGVYSLGS